MKISIIIPTLNRLKEIEMTLNSLIELTIFPHQTIIIDQSDGKDTEELVKKSDYKRLNICYLHSEIKSWALARNYGIENINKESDMVVFLDDDVLLEKDFLDQIDIFFLEHSKAKGGIANIESPQRKVSLLKKIWLFLISWSTKDQMCVTAGGFNILPFENPKNITNVEWTSGCGMFFRKELFDEGFRFEKQFMKYSLMEDCFLSYSIQRKYPKSLFFIPKVKMVHCETPTARIANKQRIYQNIIHRYYFIKKFEKSFLAYLRTMGIFCMFDVMQYKNLKVFTYYYKGLRYVFQHKKEIWSEYFNFNVFIFWEK